MAAARRDFLSEDLVVPNHQQTRLGPFQEAWAKGRAIKPLSDGTFEVMRAGIYLVTGAVRWQRWKPDPDAPEPHHDYRHIILKVNGEEDSEFTLPSTGDETDMRMPFSAMIRLKRKDRIEPFVWQVTGGDLKVIGGLAWKTWISIAKIGLAPGAGVIRGSDRTSTAAPPVI